MQIFTDKAVSELIHGLARLEAELAALWSRLDGLDKIMAHHAGTAAQLEELKSETVEWIDDLQDEDMRQSARLDALHTENAALWSRLGATRDAIVKLVRDLATRLDALEQEDWKGLMAHLHTMWHNLERRVDELEVIVSGNDRTFREIITDNAELAARIKRLEKIHAEIPFPKGENHN